MRSCHQKSGRIVDGKRTEESYQLKIDKSKPGMIEIYLQPASLRRWAYILPMSPIPMIPMDLLSLLAPAIIKGLLCGSLWQLVSRYPRQLFLTCQSVGQVCYLSTLFPGEGSSTLCFLSIQLGAAVGKRKEKNMKGKKRLGSFDLTLLLYYISQE